MKNWNQIYNLYVICVYAVVFSAIQVFRAVNKEPNQNYVETLFLNMFFNGRLKSMPPKLLSDDKRNVAPSQLGDRELFDFESLKIEVDTDLHAPGIYTPAINVVNL